MRNLLDLSLEELKIWMNENKEKEFRAKQVFDWIYNNKWCFNDMANIPKALKEKLEQNFLVGIPKVIKEFKSKDKHTIKFLLEYNDGSLIETVVMKYNYGNSICVSTQVGCNMGCSFCASTIGGKIRNLTSGEILAQILLAQKYIGERISNIVLMGSGEPFDNFDNVMKFLELVNSKNGLNIGQRHITISTCGIVPKIKELADKKLQITLAISLHASNEETRKNIMPISKKYSIEDVIQACRYYIEKTNKRVTFEYALINNVNDSEKNAEDLANILKGLLSHVNLIPVNEVEENNFKRSSDNNIKRFSDLLTKYGIENTIRREMGTDINAACGQLRRDYIKNNNYEEV